MENFYSSQSVSIPQHYDDSFEQKEERKEKKDSPNFLLPLVLVPLALLGGGAVASKMYKNSITAKKITVAIDKLPEVPRVVTMQDDNYMALYQLAHNPSTKTLIAAGAVLTAASVGFIMKNVVDGIKEIWVQREKADIKRDLEEELIETETRAFSKKIDAQRYLLAKSAKEMDKLSFTGNEEDKKKDNRLLYTILGVGTALAGGFFAKKIFKNFSQIGKFYEKNVEQALQTTEADRPVKAPEEVGGNGLNFTSYVADITAFLYTYIVHPTKQMQNLMLMVIGTAATGYAGKTITEGVKEVQVEKHNAQTELDLQNRLVEVEVENFYRKKQAFIKPVMADFKLKAQTLNKKELEAEKNKTLTEIKNAPPFIYS